MNWGYKLLFKTGFFLSLLTIMVSSAVAFMSFGLTGFLLVAGVFAVILATGGIIAYKRRHISTLGRVFGEEPIS